MPSPKSARNVVGSAVARIRSGREWSQADLAAKCQLIGWDISRGIIAGIEGGARAVQDWELLVLAKVLGVSADHLLPTKIDWDAFPVPSEKTQAKRRRVLAKVKAAVRKNRE